MATTTTNYGLPVPEGSDIVNLLTVLPQLAQLVDAQMKVNANTGIQRGTHIKSGTVNAITVDVNLATATFFTFVAADDFVEGDSFTFNGEVIAARTPEGNALKTGAFKVNQNVLCCNYNGILTIYTSQSTISVDTQLDADSANAIANAAVTAAINAINAAIGSADISTIGADVKAAIVALNNSISSANGAINTLNNNLSNLDQKVSTIKDITFINNTIPAVIGVSGQTFIPYPDGFNKDNCHIISAMYYYEGGVDTGFYDYSFVASNAMPIAQLMLADSGIRITVSSNVPSGYLGKPMRIAITKI